MHWVPRAAAAESATPRVAGSVQRARRARRRRLRDEHARACVARVSLARRPIVVKLVADEAYERARRSGSSTAIWTTSSASGRRPCPGSAAGARPGAPAGRPARSARAPTSRRSRSPGASPRSASPCSRTPRRRCPPLPERDEARARFGVEGPTLAFAGRITRQKALEVALAALARVEGVTLLVAGDGPDLAERSAARRRARGLDGRVRFVGPLDRDGVLALFRAADASLLSSSWENFPHTVVEALAVGTPVVATAVGGVPELVRDGENGLLVPAGDADALAARDPAHGGRPGLRERLAGSAAPSVEHLERSASTRGSRRSCGRCRSGERARKPRVLFVGRARLRFPLGQGLERRFEALSGELDWRQLGTALDGRRPPDPRFALARPFPVRLLDGPLWYLRAARAGSRASCGASSRTPSSRRARRRRRSCCSAGASRGSRAKVVLDLHGDWRSPTRLYGSKARRLLDPFVGRARAPRPPARRRRADDQRVHDRARPRGGDRAGGRVPRVHGSLRRSRPSPPAPLPETPRALFVGVLERYKAFDVLADAWRPGRARGAGRRPARRRAGDAGARGGGARRRASGPGRVDAGAERRGGRRRARRRDAARAAVALGGHGARRDRGGLPRPAGRRQPGGGDPGRGRGRRDRRARAAGRRRRARRRARPRAHRPRARGTPRRRGA